MSENDSMHVRYSVFTLQKAYHNKIEKKTLSKLVFMQVSQSGGVRVWVSESGGG